jgi:hypothetical protein
MKNKSIISLVLFVSIFSFLGCQTTRPKPVASVVNSKPLPKVPVDVDFAATAIMTHLRGAKVPSLVKVKFDPALKRPDKSMAKYQSFAIVGNDLFSYQQKAKKPEFKLAEGVLHLRDLFGRNAHLHYKVFYELKPDAITLMRYQLAPLFSDKPAFRVIAVESDVFFKAPQKAFESWESLYTLASRLDLIMLKAKAKDLKDKKICVLAFCLDEVKKGAELKLLLAEEDKPVASWGVDEYSKYLKFAGRPVAMVQGKLFSNPAKPLFVKLTLKTKSGFKASPKVLFKENIKKRIAK